MEEIRVREVSLSPKSYLIPWLVLAAILTAVGCFTGYSLYEEHERLDGNERERLNTQAAVVEKNLSAQLYGVYRALDGIRSELPRWQGEGWARLANGKLGALNDAMTGISAILIADANGTITASNRAQIIGRNIRYREYFQAPLKGGEAGTLYVTPPFRSMLGNFVLNVSLMVPGPKGEFAGVVSAALNPEHFKSLLGSVLYAPDMWAALAHGDGRQFLMVPEREGMSGLDLAKPGSFFSRHMESGRAANVLTGVVLATGEERMMAVQTIRPATLHMDKPLVVAVGRKISAIYAHWPEELLVKGAMFGVLVLTTTSLLYLYQRRQRRYDAVSAEVVAELHRAWEDARDANQAQSRFLATAAHEFRTPLALLASSTDILDSYGDSLGKEELAKQYDHIRSAARQINSLIDSVISGNRMEAEHHRNRPVPLDLPGFCRTVAEEVNASCGNCQELTVVCDENCGSVQLDEPLFRRIVENLLTNAFRYTPAGGSVTLSVSRAEGTMHLAVTDSGIGIPEEELERIFEAYYRCGNVGGRRGMGLGLSMVRDAVRQMDGSISVESVLGEGTAVRLTIPVGVADAVEEQQCIRS